ncbi:hypothetical protein DN752_17865 [Echinicola strongylocentroti]|uniref:Uncharacterized protein n=1 Tax=Echinicola strongylocentroti TaxID=1795355 RepID=A0A2Z4IMA7_9BACT|nr:hypothetical protein [Echinicola strongylocentroti]AWW31847.1 hypothetical protein DN752_17865 [Echinicola strongylocentroti]
MSDLKTTPILDGKYEVVGVKPGPIGTKLGVINLAKINEKTAERLINLGTSYLRKVAAPTDKPAKTDKK